MDDVKVHYNSSQPAQLNALAYAQGTDIHIASGQEKHLAHEAWHVVQQKQGRVKPTLQMKQGIPVNDDAGLENEADVMGAKATQLKSATAPVFANNQYFTSPTPVQKIDDIEMRAGEGELKKSFARKLIVDVLYTGIIKGGFAHKMTARDLNAFLTDDYKGKGGKDFTAAGAEEKAIMVKELLARKFHDDTAAEEITPEMRMKLGAGKALTEGEEDTVGPDILASTVTTANKKKGTEQEIISNLTPGKACVITGLMFAEGGGVLGAESVEELHFILSTRFKTTWRHYSEDKVYASLYRHMGYTETVPGEETTLERISTLTADYTHGMASIEGHIVGFKKEGITLHLRDNDEGMKLPSTHTKKRRKILAIWHK